MMHLTKTIYPEESTVRLSQPSEAMALKERGIEIHGLGIQLQSDPAAGLSKQK